MKIALPGRRRPPGDNMLPVINIVFLLLIFFMLLGAMSAPDAFAVRPPQSAAQAPSDPAETVLAIGLDGRMALGRLPVAPRHLASELAAWRARHPGRELQVKADAGADAGQVVEVLETLRAAGIARVSLLTSARVAVP